MQITCYRCAIVYIACVGYVLHEGEYTQIAACKVEKKSNISADSRTTGFMRNQWHVKAQSPYKDMPAL